MSATTFTELLLEREIPLPEPNARPVELALPLPALSLPAVSLDRATPVRGKARTGRRAARRRARLDWEAIAVILLILVCTAVCVYRLFWSMQP